MQTAKEGRGAYQAKPRRTSWMDMAILPQFEVTVGEVVVAVLVGATFALFWWAMAFGEWIEVLGW